jgi:hypothetical protein
VFLEHFSSIACIFEAFLEDFGSPSSIAIVFGVYFEVLLKFWLFLELCCNCWWFGGLFVLTCTNPREFAPPMTGDAALGSPLVFF